MRLLEVTTGDTPAQVVYRRQHVEASFVRRPQLRQDRRGGADCGLYASVARSRTLARHRLDRPDQVLDRADADHGHNVRGAVAAIRRFSSPSTWRRRRRLRRIERLSQYTASAFAGEFDLRIMDGVRLTESTDDTDPFDMAYRSFRGAAGRLRRPPRYAAFDGTSSPTFSSSALTASRNDAWCSRCLTARRA